MFSRVFYKNTSMFTKIQVCFSSSVRNRALKNSFPFTWCIIKKKQSIHVLYICEWQSFYDSKIAYEIFIFSLNLMFFLFMSNRHNIYYMYIWRKGVLFLPRLNYGIATIKMMHRLESLNICIWWLIIINLIVVLRVLW